MKKVFTLTAVLLLGTISMLQAQFILGGNLGFTSQKYTEEDGNDKSESTLTNINLIPRLGYAFGDFWAGLDVGISSLKVDEPDFDNEYKINVTNVSPFIRYINKPTENLGVWVEGQAGFAFGKAEEDGEEVAKYSGINIGLRPGVIFYIGKHLTFEASFGRLGFNQTTVTDPDDSNYKTKTSETGFSLNNNAINLNALYFLEDFPLTVTNGFLFGVNYSFGGPAADK